MQPSRPLPETFAPQPGKLPPLQPQTQDLRSLIQTVPPQDYFGATGPPQTVQLPQPQTQDLSKLLQTVPPQDLNVSFPPQTVKLPQNNAKPAPQQERMPQDMSQLMQTAPPQDLNVSFPPQTVKLPPASNYAPLAPLSGAPAGNLQSFSDPEQNEKISLLKQQSPKPQKAVSGVVQALLMVSVIVLGCASIISRQIVAKSLSRFSYMLSLSTAVAYTFVYFGILFVLIKTNRVPMEQLEWAWITRGSYISSKAAPWLKFFLVAALGDAIGDTFGYICTPYVAGPIHSLLAQCTVMFTVPLSACILGTRYSFYQFLGLVGVEIAVVIGVIPSLGGKGVNSTNPYFATLLGGSCFFNALAFVMKECAFVSYMMFTNMATRRVKGFETYKDDTESGLSIFIVNSHASLFQLPFTLLLVPLAQATGQTKGENVFQYLQEGFGCLFGDTTENDNCVYAGRCTLIFIFLNISWNLVILLNVKINGAVATFVALKAIFPICMLLFAFVHWPMLGKTTVHTITWTVLAILLPCIAFYTWASAQQKALGDKATCCGCPPCLEEEDESEADSIELTAPTTLNTLGSFGNLGPAGTFGSLGTSFSPSTVASFGQSFSPGVSRDRESSEAEPSEEARCWPCASGEDSDSSE